MNNSYSTTIPTQDEKFAEHEWIKILMAVISSLSMFGSITIIVTYFLFENLRTTSRKILVYISIGDFFTVFPYLVIRWYNSADNPDRDPDKYSKSHNCQAQSFVSTTAVMWSFMWTSSLAIYLYLSVVKQRVEMAEKLMVLFHGINWGVPLVLVGVALCCRALGFHEANASGGWCWIKRHPEHWETVLWMLACGKFCEIVSYFVNEILCFCVYRKVKEEVSMAVEVEVGWGGGGGGAACSPILGILERLL